MIPKPTQPILTIIVPVYNTEFYLPRCLDSIINQSLKEIEVIVIDDQSTDRSPAILKEYSKKYNNIVVYSTSAKSLAGGARNIGLENAKGRYVGFVDSDDWIDTTMYEKLTFSMEKEKADIAICGIMKEYNNAFDAFCKYRYDSENVLEGPFAFDILARRINQDVSISPIVCNKIYRMDFIKDHKIAFVPNNYNEDDVFNYISFFNAKKVVITPNTYYHYYQRNDSITHSFSKKHMSDLFVAFKIIKEYLEEKKMFQEYRKHYYAYFEKTAGFVLNLLTITERDIQIQNMYIKYFLNRSGSLIDLTDYMQHCGLQKLRDFLHPTSIK